MHLLQKRPDRLWGPTVPPIQWLLGAFSPSVMRPEYGADHSSPSDAKFKNEWNSYHHSAVCFHGLYSESFTSPDFVSHEPVNTGHTQKNGAVS